MHTKEEFEGTGIGLASVKRIVSRHSGRIWADAKPGGGASFYSTLSGKGELEWYKSRRLRVMPVVLLTSSREEQDLIMGYKLGANACVVKPVDFDNFMQSIRQIGGFWALINELPPER